MSETQVRIISDGIGRHTRVEVNGVLLTNVTAATWTCEANGVATAKLELCCVETDVVGELDDPDGSIADALVAGLSQPSHRGITV